MVIPEFGARLEGIVYRSRPGGYLIVRNEAGEVAVVQELGGWFLPGGGQDAGESAEAAAIREAHEECAFRVTIEREVGVADEFVFSEAEGAYLHKRCTFFSGRVIALDDRHAAELPVSWIAAERAIRELSHGSQRWAVARACGL